MKRTDIRTAYAYLSKIDGLSSRIAALREADADPTNLTIDLMKKDKTSFKVGINPNRAMIDGIINILTSQAQEAEKFLQEMGIE